MGWFEKIEKKKLISRELKINYKNSLTRQKTTTIKLKRMVKLIFSTALFVLFISGCAINRTYNVSLINSTEYRIDNLQIGCGKHISNASISPFDTTENLKIPFNYLVAFTEPLMCMTITNYSDSLEKFIHSSGNVIAESDLKKRDNNFVLIKLKDNQEKKTEIFEIKLIE